MKGNSEGSKDADVGFELNVKSREMLDEGQKWGGGGVALCLRVPALVSFFFFFGNNNYFKSCCAGGGNTFLRTFKSILLLSSTLLWCCCYAEEVVLPFEYANES